MDSEKVLVDLLKMYVNSFADVTPDRVSNLGDLKAIEGTLLRMLDVVHDIQDFEAGRLEEDDGQPDEAQEWADFGEVYIDESDSIY